MGIQSLQDFIDSSASFSVQLPKFLEESKIKTSNLLLVHADSCIRQFYHEHVDWVCGGQWNELFQSVQKFVRAFRQSDIELVVFFDGSLNDASLHNWSSKHRFYRDIVRETLSHVINNQNIPFRTKTKNFVAPGALKSALRLAFRSFDVMVCCSLEDIYKESLLFGKDENCLGVIANDANFLLSSIPRYINLGNVRWLKKIFSACKVYNFNCILENLDLEVEQLPYLAALLGNFMINDATLSSFYWELIEEDHPLKKIQVHLFPYVLIY